MDPYIGQCILGQFWIETIIGKGGMGSVYKAKQPDMDRMVAVKVLHPRLAARQDLVLRFRREARAMSKLTHPNTAKVFLFGQLDTGALYIVMEFLEGKNLLQFEKDNGPFSPERAARIMIQVCGALEEAHKLGIIHRDLKPENIVLTNQGGIEDFPKVLDFGLAKMNDPDPSTGSLRVLTQQGAIFGTPEFMSPEQAKGEPLDPRSDIYSLGVILYEMLTCKLPFKARNPMDFIAHHIKAEPIPVHQRVTGTPLVDRHWGTLSRALRKERADRYQSAKEFADGLAAWVVDGSRSEARTDKPVYMNKPASKPPVQAVAVTAPPASKPAVRPQDQMTAPVVQTVQESGSKKKVIFIAAAVVLLFLIAMILAIALM
jgi:serine/threonine protein kinase